MTTDLTVTLPARHVHLDFHTSEHLKGIGSGFSRQQFQQALKLGRVNHLTIFAKCHHSWCYFPTNVGKRHPHLSFDLLGEQIAACREIGVRCPIYITVGWSATDADNHPEWVILKKDGSQEWFNQPADGQADTPRPIVSWKNLCIATGYRQHVLDLTREVCERYAPVDGIFFDICNFERSFSVAAVTQMREAGINLEDDQAVKTWYHGQWHDFMREANAIIHGLQPGASIFYNGRAGIDTPEESFALQTHLELEDLPTTWGGYDKFAPRIKFFDAHPMTRDMAKLAMSGKFHTMWGEFGGYKHADALRFEAASMIAYGATCSFGDQLPPDGALDLATYKNIGEAYAYVKKIEPYGLGGRPYSNLGLWLTCLDRTDMTTPVAGVVGGSQKLDHDYGVTNMLMEAQRDFTVVGSDEDLAHYACIILTGSACLNSHDIQRLERYVAAGGSLLVIGASALDPAKKRFVLDVGARYVGPARHAIDYTLVEEPLAKGMVAAPFLNYESALRAKPAAQTTILARLHEPYFERTVGHYCSHQNTPFKLTPAAHPAALQNGQVIWLAHPVGALYFHHGARLHRQLFLNALDRIYHHPVLETNLLSAGRAVLTHQADQRRYVAHLLYASPQQRGRCTVIEDLPTLIDVPVALRVPQKIIQVDLPLHRTTLSMTRRSSVVRVTVPRVHCHEVVVFHY